ncbi:hypoxanthine/guanine phosphoribosyltransferase [Methanolobus mangrovi]|uniref:Hypoxanthine/guanine phosphoribosyltransferase n=1 Tax=Methanolobus mangrovi TaxID=3072977 RepID=A0AA51UF79_9EURY|nr:hypoxanthine/guanine phosphoribosyltransferase [Methanolobus mangrovi]WMW22152.1 hypoxanthine/guanine phosphoribosyltransferase [Methanolobus mangrovi]
MLKILRESLLNAPIVRRGDYYYFIHPISDGVPQLEPELLEEITEHIVGIVSKDFDKILAIEAMGIPLATSISMKTGIPFSIIRKRPYGLDGEIKLSQETGYSKGELYVNDVRKGDKVLIVDDVISTGGTLVSLIKALEDIGAIITDTIVVIERGDGLSRLKDIGIDIKTLIRIDVTENGVTIEDTHE